MDIKKGQMVRIGDISYRVVEIDSTRSNYYCVQAEGKELCWVSGDYFTYTLDEMVAMGYFRNGVSNSVGHNAQQTATSSEIHAAFSTSRQELRTRGLGGIVRK